MHKYFVQRQIIWLMLSFVNIILIIIDIYLLIVLMKNGIKVSNRWFTINIQTIIIIIVVISLSSNIIAPLLNIFAQKLLNIKSSTTSASLLNIAKNQPQPQFISGHDPHYTSPHTPSYSQYQTESVLITNYYVDMNIRQLTLFKVFDEKSDENEKKISFYDIAVLSNTSLKPEAKIEFPMKMTLFDFCKQYKSNISVIDEENAKKAFDILSYFCIQHIIRGNFRIFIYDVSEIKNMKNIKYAHVARLNLYNELLDALIEKLNKYGIETNQPFYSMNWESAKQHLINIEFKIINSIISDTENLNSIKELSQQERKYTKTEMENIIKSLPPTYFYDWDQKKQNIPDTASSKNFAQILIDLAAFEGSYGGSGEYDYKNARATMQLRDTQK